MADPGPTRAGSNGRHETSDLDPGAVARLGVGLLAALALVALIGTFFMYRHFEGRDIPRSGEGSTSSSEAPPRPHLQALPALDLERSRAAEDAALGRYGWVDRDRGVARIPITRAMDLIAERGLPTISAGAALPDESRAGIRSKTGKGDSR